MIASLELLQDWVERELLSSADAVIVFGSQAVGCADGASDLDVLVVAEQPVTPPPGVDCVRVAPHRIRSEGWRGSELAGHVARFGRWVFGPRWVVTDHCAALRRKELLLRAKAKATSLNWQALSETHRERHSVELRREAQRLGLLLARLAVEPRPLLDGAWNRFEGAEAWASLALSDRAEESNLIQLATEFGRWRGQRSALWSTHSLHRWWQLPHRQ